MINQEVWARFSRSLLPLRMAAYGIHSVATSVELNVRFGPFLAGLSSSTAQLAAADLMADKSPAYPALNNARTSVFS